MINTHMAEQLFREDPSTALGSSIIWRGESWEIIGIVGSTSRYEMGHKPMSQFYVAHAHLPNGTSYVLRSSIDPMTLIDDIRYAVSEVSPGLPLTNLHRLSDRANGFMGYRRMGLWMISTFAAVALILAAMGVFGVMTYTAAQRTREIGIRMALDASDRKIVLLVMGDSIRLMGIGVAIGVVFAAAAGRFLSGQLYEVSGLDPISYLSAVALLALVGILTSLWPAWRASRAKSVSVLRVE